MAAGPGDVPPIVVAFIDEPDLRFNPTGSRGVGELGVANAVSHATGKRVRDLPITPEKLA